MATAGLADQPDPDNPGWLVWGQKDLVRFNSHVFGKLSVRRDDDGRARLRMMPQNHHTNLVGTVHGGALLSLADVAVFAIPYLLGHAVRSGAVTLDLTMQFLAPAQVGSACDAVGEVLKETGRLVFVRGLLEQGEVRVAAFSGTLRKLSDSPGQRR
jgi:uncharacterized protein (TIGR00369 family)